MTAVHGSSAGLAADRRPPGSASRAARPGGNAHEGLKLEDADLGIDGGRFQLFMSKQLLDVADVRAAFEHVRGARVPDQVRPGAAVDACLLDVVSDLAA